MAQRRRKEQLARSSKQRPLTILLCIGGGIGAMLSEPDHLSSLYFGIHLGERYP